MSPSRKPTLNRSRGTVEAIVNTMLKDESLTEANSLTAVQGFHTVANSSLPLNIQSASGDILFPPAGYITNQTVPLSVNSSGVAVGYYQYNANKPLSAYWAPRSVGTTNSAALDGWIWKSPVDRLSFDSVSKFISINDGNWAVGWSGDGSTVQRAVLARGLGAPMIDLNDRHFLYGDSGWTLQSAVGINSQNSIIGNGKNGNYNRGFVLIPRVPGQ